MTKPPMNRSIEAALSLQVPESPSFDEFESLSLGLAEASHQIEQLALAAICQRLARIKAVHPDLQNVYFYSKVPETPALQLDFGMRDDAFLRDMAPLADQITRAFETSASNAFYTLTRMYITIEGPDAESFALQMNRPDVAALLEASAIERLSAPGAPPRQRTSL